MAKYSDTHEAQKRAIEAMNLSDKEKEKLKKGLDILNDVFGDYEETGTDGLYKAPKQ